MHANNAGLMGVSGWHKVRRISLGSWINCPQEVFHRCETKNVYFTV